MKLKMRILSCMLLVVLLFGVLFSFSSCGEVESQNALSEGAPSLENNEGSTVTDSSKVIVEITVDAVTDQFDADHVRLKQEIAESGGYVANSSVSYEDNSGNALKMTIKIPAEKATAFADSLAEYLEIQSLNVSSDDVTTQYIDVESRIAALESERDSLQAMMESTDDYNNMMVVSKRLYEVIAELESQKSILASLDQRIAYSTIYLTLTESEDEVTGRNDGFFARVGRSFMNSLDFVGRFFTGLGVFFIGNLPTLLLIAVIVFGIVWIVKWRKKRKKTQK